MGRKKKKKGEGAEGDPKEKKAKGNLVPAVIIAVGLVLGGKMMGGGGSGAAVPVAAETTTTTVPEGPVVKVDPITLNMADGRFVRVGLGFQMAHSEEGGGGGHGAPAEPDTTDAAGHYAKALDIVIEVLGGKRYEELVDPHGREEAKNEIVGELKHAYHDEIEDLYFTEFVLQ
jgi:flagellar protein FliL